MKANAEHGRAQCREACGDKSEPIAVMVDEIRPEPNANDCRDRYQQRRREKDQPDLLARGPEALVREIVPCCRRRTGAIPFLLGHVSVQTTEPYLGCKQRIRGAVNDRIGIEP